ARSLKASADGADRISDRRPRRDRHGRVVLDRRSAFADQPTAVTPLRRGGMRVPPESPGPGFDVRRVTARADAPLLGLRDGDYLFWLRMGMAGPSHASRRG